MRVQIQGSSFFLRTFRILLIGTILLGLAAPLTAYGFSRNPLYALIKQGVEKGFNLEEKEAVALLNRALEMDRENPFSCASLAFAHLFFFELGFDEKERKAYQETMVAWVNQAVAKAEKRLEKDARDAEAVWAMALAKLTMTRFYMGQRRHIALAREARNIWDHLERVRELDPENHDVFFARGILHYHIDHLPGLTRFLSSLWITSGDREKGLGELKLAADKGYLFKELAQAELASVYMNFERRPDLALPLAQELKGKFPRNYNLLFLLANIHSGLGLFPEAMAILGEIKKGIQSGTPPFRPELWSRYHLAMGKILFDQGDYDRASLFFQQVNQNTARYNARNRAWALVRLGMIHDIRKEREGAEKYYQAALEIEGGEGVGQALAKTYLRTPYTPTRKNPASLPGPQKMD